jgi:hypothetical protein
MVVYKCTRCGDEFSRKHVYERHVNRKFPCQSKQDPIEVLQHKIDGQNTTINGLKEELLHTIRDHQEELSRLHAIIEEKNLIIEEKNNIIEDKNKQLLAMSQKTNKSKKIHITNGNGNVNVNVINLTTFGRERKSDLNRKEMLSVLNSGDSCFLSMIRHIHANARLPQYQNVCVTNLRATGAYIFEDDNWNYRDYDHLLYMLMTARMSDLEEMIRDEDLVREIRNISRVKAVVDNYWDDSDKFVKENKHRIINLLYNYTKNHMT